MADNSLVTNIAEWLVDQALSEPDIVDMFENVCHRLHAIGIPVARARLTWPTLHPLFLAETILWTKGQPTVFEQFKHQEQVSDDWLQSPMKYMLDNKVHVLRRNLDGPDKVVDFPILDGIIAQGLTDYLVIATNFSGTAEGDEGSRKGIFVTWSSDRKGGFSASDIEALQRILRRFAIACRTAIQSRIARNITETYLGEEAGSRVLKGEIKRGDGSEIQAVVWYSDLRNSTALADTMESKDFIAMLNVYFECAAGPVIEAGGNVLDFIGDAVLAIFPYKTARELPAAGKAAIRALRDAVRLTKQINEERKSSGLLPIKFGTGLNTGTVMFGNIGIPQRLAFSVIGPTVNEVARIEKITKAVEADALVTKEIADIEPEIWATTGTHALEGIAQKIELFALKQPEADLAAEAGEGKSAAVEKRSRTH